MPNLVIYITAEYEDKEGGQAKFEEKVSADIFDLSVTEAKIDEAVGRLIYHMGEFRDKEPLPEDNED